jgi:CTP synthase
LAADSLVRQLYQEDVIRERHRHRYEFNNFFLQKLSDAGLSFTGKSSDDRLAEVVEIADHPWYLGCQFHPEFTSTPRDGHPLFTGFIKAARKKRFPNGETTEYSDAETSNVVNLKDKV